MVARIQDSRASNPDAVNAARVAIITSVPEIAPPGGNSMICLAMLFAHRCDLSQSGVKIGSELLAERDERGD